MDRVWNGHDLRSTDVSRGEFVDGCCDSETQYSGRRHETADNVPHASPRELAGWLVGRPRPHLHNGCSTELNSAPDPCRYRPYSRYFPSAGSRTAQPHCE